VAENDRYLTEAVGSSLVFVVDARGQLLSLGWSLAAHLEIALKSWIGRSLSDWIVEPDMDDEALLSILSEEPRSDLWAVWIPPFRLQGQVQLTPVVLTPQNRAWVGSLTILQAGWEPAPPPQLPPEEVRSQLTHLIWEIRRTLDLETVWQQTIDGLTAVFQAAWGVVCTYELHAPEAKVMAIGCNPGCPSTIGERIALADYPCLQQAIQSRQSLWLPIDAPCPSPDQSAAVLCGIIRHQGEPNGLILLCPSEQTRWELWDRSQLQEMLDQVGIAISHAYLFRDAQGLADELQAANQRLLRKHRELEEARQQAEEASRLKSEFLANTSHELRTPLNGMIGFLRLILDGMADDPEEQQDFLEEAHKSALHLLNLINDVLDIAKIEAGKMQIDMAQVNLRELFTDLENFTRPQAEQKGLEFILGLPPTRDEIVVYGNYQRILQVMLNLVGNAIKFTHEGSVTISAEIKFQKVMFQEQEWPGAVKVSVADTGIGVSLEKQDRLFQSFSQVDGERTRQYGGTGLGLAISQRLVEAMGGVVHFVSMGEGLGSTVSFTTLLYQEPVMIE
jgi:signal transduction histidine kinase